MRKKKSDGFETGLEAGSVLAKNYLTSAEVQAQEFRLAFRGYNEKDVDAFLDRITEEFERLTTENQRLRAGGSSDGGSAIADAARAAEEIRRRAGEEAAAIVAAAQAQAGGSGAAIPAGNSSKQISKFVLTEKQFLESLADLIRGHAETVKSTVREAKAEQAAARSVSAVTAATVAGSPDVAAGGSGEPQTPVAEAPAESSAESREEIQSSVSAAPVFSSPPAPSDSVEESAWTATASPAAAAPAVADSAFTTTQRFDRESGVSSADEPAARPWDRDEVISIPPSPVDTPSDAWQEMKPSDSGSAVSVEIEERSQTENKDQESILFESAPASAEQSEESGEVDLSNNAPAEERSLRELFWGED